MIVTRRYQYELFPSPIHQRYLGQIFGCVRFVPNELIMTNKSLRKSGQSRLVFSEMQGMLPGLKEMYPFLKNCPSQTLQVAIQDLDVAYQNAKKVDYKGRRAGQPKIKKKNSKNSFQLPQPKIAEVGGQMCIFIPNYKVWIPFKMHRPLPQGKVGAATITKTKTGRYYVSIVVTFDDARTIESRSKDILGVDINIHEFVCSDGTRIETPKRMTNLEKRQRRLQQALRRKEDAVLKAIGLTRAEVSRLSKKERTAVWKEVRGLVSEKYKKTKKALAKTYERIKFSKKDYLHKTALQLFRKNQAIALETLNVRGMMKNRKLARSIAARNWGYFIQIMKVYAVQYGKDLHFADQWFPSSKRCSGCHAINEDLKLSDREWTCKSCGIHHDRDLNAAVNIKCEGGSYPAYRPVESSKILLRPKGRRTRVR